MRRMVQPELLDSLPANDPAAIGSRHDLRRLNRWMRNDAHLRNAILSLPAFPTSVLELGAGDGTFMLRVAQRLPRPQSRRVHISLLDMEPVVEPATIQKFSDLGWDATVVRADLREWLKNSEHARVDLITANLFLHHFEDAELSAFFNVLAPRTNTFISCDPRRWKPALFTTRLLWCIGCNHVTRHDAPASVRAGFAGRELSELWPATTQFQLRESPAGLASHLFVATQPASTAAPGRHIHFDCAAHTVP